MQTYFIPKSYMLAHRHYIIEHLVRQMNMVWFVCPRKAGHVYTIGVVRLLTVSLEMVAVNSWRVCNSAT